MKDTLERMRRNLEEAERNEDRATKAVGQHQQQIQAHKIRIDYHWAEIEKLAGDKSKFTELLRAKLAVDRLKADISEIEATEAQ